MARAKKAVVEKKRSFFEDIQQVTADKGFDRQEIIEVVEAGLVAAYKRKYRTTDNIRVVMDKDKDDVYVVARRVVVDNIVLPGMQILLEDARKLKSDAALGEEIDIVEYPLEFGRIAAQTAMQIVAQKLRQLEQNKVREAFEDKIGEIMNGYILRKRGDTVYVDLGKVEAIMPVKHQIPKERYRVEDKIKVLLHSIEQDKGGGPLRVIVSRADRMFVQKLFEKEVPEIFEKIVVIKTIGRIAGERSKVVVTSERQNVDPVGACVGVRGVRIQAIVRELGTERIDIVEWANDPREFITNALTPASPSLVKVDPTSREALAVVPDKDLAIAIGREGTNVKIASYVTGYKIDVKSETQFSTEMASPEARKRLDEIFEIAAPVEETAEEETGTPLTALPGLAPRIIRILKDNNIKYIEDLVSMGEEDLIHIEGIGRATAKRIMEIISENVEFEEDEEEQAAQELDAEPKA
ncbi:MAG: transcription termination/antitermination protein NusA [Spirochaetes bacterium]|nr:transcription termination/antitermination protein NusA [Spirochaetota bacterium]